MDALIRFVCRAPDHAPRPGARGDLTVYERSWAYCPAEAHEGHAWEKVGGVTVRDLVRYGLREPQAGAAP